MKVRVTFIILIASVFTNAQYQPSGYRPPGPKFGLPQRPQNEYGAPPQLSSANSLPTLQPNDFRGAQPSFLFRSGNTQYGFATDSSRQSNFGQSQQYGFTGSGNIQNSHGGSSNPGNEARIRSSNTQYGFASDSSRQSNFDQSQQYGFTGSGNNQNGDGGSRLGTSSNPRNEARFRSSNTQYGFATDSSRQSNFGQSNADDSVPTQATKQHGFGGQNNHQQANAQGSNQTPNNQNAEDFGRNSDDEDVVGTANQNYLPPPTTTTATERFDQTQTRAPPNTREHVDDNESVNPNVAIANAFAKSQYYLLQPNGNVQRIVYQTSQSEEEMKNCGYSGYQSVAPITAPFYSFNSPLIRLY